MQLGNLTKYRRQKIFEFLDTLSEKEKIQYYKSFKLFPVNWRDNYSVGWRLRYSSEELEEIGSVNKLKKLVGMK